MDHAANVSHTYQVFRNLAGARGFDLALILAQLRRHKLHSESLINLRLTLHISNGRRLAASLRSRLEFSIDREFVQLSQMRPRTGRIEERHGEFRRLDHDQGRLESLTQNDDCAIGSLLYHSFDHRKAQEMFEQGMRPLRAGNDYDLRNGFFPSSQPAG